jgi:WD40 repeat protein
LIRRIGKGAFGEVWLARNIMGTYRAVKVVYRRNFSDERPYHREFRGLQKFEPISRSHDGFVDILDTGLDVTQGYFFYVMELADDVVSGNQIDPDLYEPKTLDKETPGHQCVGVQTCVSLGVSLSAALSHLHQHGLLHRDIKPSNIIFVNGIPKIADIGLVSNVEGTRTFAGGTEGYFSANEGPGTVQADIYALGKVLYELSTGQDRCEFPNLPTRLEEMQDPDQFRELNQVILKACEEDPHKRYRKAEDLHADLLLLMAGKSVQRIRALEKRVARLVQVGLAAALILLITGGVLYAWNRQQLRLAVEQRLGQARLNAFHGNMLVDEGDYFGALPFFWEALRLEQGMPLGEKNNRLRISALLEQCPRMNQLLVLSGQHLNGADLASDGRYLITAGRDGTATLCDLTKGSRPQFWLEDKELESVALSPNGNYLATAGESFVRIWDLATHSLVSTAAPPATVYGVKFTPDGSQFVTASGNDTEGHVYLYDTKKPGGGTELTNSSHAYRCAAFSRDGTRLVMAGEDGVAQVWDFKDRQPIGMPVCHNQGLKTNWIFCAAFSPDASRVVTAGSDGTTLVCEAETGKPIFLLPHPAAVKRAEFSPDGRYVVTACWDNTARIWDASTGKLVFPTLKQRGKFLICVWFTPDGRRVLTVNANGVICLWDLVTPLSPGPVEGPVLVSQDGQRLCMIRGNNVDVFDATNHARASRLLLPGVRDVKLNKDGSRLVTLSKAQPGSLATATQLWDTQRRVALSAPFSMDCAVGNAFLSDSGRYLVIWKGNQATVWDMLAGAPVYPPLNHAEKVAAPDIAQTDKAGCFSPNGTWLATITTSNVYIWNAVKGSLQHVLPHIDSVEHVAFSPDSRLLVTSCGSPGTLLEREAQIWDVFSGKRVGLPLQHGDGVLYAEFNCDGTRVVTASEDGSARVWEVPTGKPLLVLEHRSTVAEARFSLDGRWIVTACEGSGTARVWDAQTGEPLTPPLKQPWPFKHAQFVGDRREIICRRSSWQGGASTFWELPIETRSIEELAELVEVLSGHEGGFTGVIVPQTPEDLQKTWKRLREQHPRDFTVPQADVINWHVREAEASEKGKQWGAAVFHWDYLIQTMPDNQSYHDHLNHARDHLTVTTNTFDSRSQ